MIDGAVTNHFIFIIDDSSDDIELAKMALESSGRKVSVETARNGESALEILRNFSVLPDLVLLDMKMPGMSGIDVLREIRSDNELKELTVIMLTSSSLGSDKAEAFDAGVNGFLHKAFEITRFSEDIRSLLDQYVKD